MGGLQCIKYLVFVFNFLFWVCSVIFKVLWLIHDTLGFIELAGVSGIWFLFRLKQVSVISKEKN